MSVTLDEVKAALRVAHGEDDLLLGRLILSATDETLRLLDTAGMTDATLPPVGNQAVVLLVQADYDGDPEKRPVYRRAAEQLIYGYRTPGIC